MVGWPGDPDDCGLLYSPSYAIFKLRPKRQVLQMHGNDGASFFMPSNDGTSCSFNRHS